MATGDAGAPLNAATLNDGAAQCARMCFAAFDAVEQFKGMLDGFSEADLVAKGLSAAGATDMKSAFTDLGKLANVFKGTDTVSPAQDFRTFSRRMLGNQLR